ncbi:hypothetical protein [Nocardia sp. CNY236]|uniref:hypothetical protein n=1 Tax=Nocardia sp. CNY236 TaxID=1169152 RepID=UPI0004121EBA|nr:hypothetical protein [Nocardia sp. CNY236]
MTEGQCRRHVFDLVANPLKSPRGRIKADPIAWMVSHAVGERIADDPLPSDAGPTGLVVASSIGPVTTQAQVRIQTDTGRLSPRLFAAASPGTLAAVACTVHGLHGPSLVFTSLGDQGMDILGPVVTRWLSSGCGRVVVACHEQTSPDRHVVTTTIQSNGMS